MTQDCLAKQFLPVLQSLAKDPVANVRMNVLKTIRATLAVWKDKVLDAPLHTTDFARTP